MSADGPGECRADRRHLDEVRIIGEAVMLPFRGHARGQPVEDTSNSVRISTWQKGPVMNRTMAGYEFRGVAIAVLLAVLVLWLWLASDDRKQPALAPGSSNHLELSDVCSQVCSWSWKAFRCSAGCRIRVHLPMLQGSCTLYDVKVSVHQKWSLCGSSSSGVAELSDTSGANSAPAPFSKLRGGAAAVTPTQLVQSFVAATERGDAAAALKLVTDDFLYKTYRATTDSLAAAEARLQTKFPAPTKVTPPLFPP
eukprot:scaffold80056_cov63-Phaeocystis_antarctica.AAC.1